jgi:copper(I)-binding protein
VLLSGLVAFPALAQPASSPPVKVEAAWVRASVPGQAGTGAFMRLTASEPLSLVGVATPVAGVAEVHEMKLEGDVMRMRAIPSLVLPAAKTVDLRPGGYHLMLMDLKAPLKPDTRVPITLVLRDAKGAERRLELQVAVSARAPAGAHAQAASDAGHGHGPGHSHGHGHGQGHGTGNAQPNSRH